MTYLGENVPKLGFGLMRLPMTGDSIDVEQVKVMVDRFLGAGFTYFDTAYGYNDGESETAAKAAIVDRHPRESFQLVTKLPAWLAGSAEEAKRMFWTSLERTGAGYFDFYLLHNLGDTRTKAFDDFGIWDFARELKEKGLIRHLGFSMHDKAEALDAVLTKHPEAEFVQLQINYADWESVTVQSRRCFEVARAHGKPVVIMEPVKGGMLANPPAPVADTLRRANPKASFASWALRFAASLPGLVTVLSGMSDMAQMEDNIATMTNFRPLDDGERAVVEQARVLLEAIPTVPCTACRYCVKGCPKDIPIPDIFSALNSFTVFEMFAPAKRSYWFATRSGATASTCIECGQCKAVCPQHIAVVEELKKAAAVFDEKTE